MVADRIGLFFCCETKKERLWIVEYAAGRPTKSFERDILRCHERPSSSVAVVSLALGYKMHICRLTEKCSNEKSHVTSVFQSLKLKRDLVAIFLRIEDNQITVFNKLTSDKTFDDVVKQMEAMGERDCCYVIYDHRFKSDDGILNLQKLFLITYIPRGAFTEDKLKYGA